jgi:MFS family permease
MFLVSKFPMTQTSRPRNPRLVLFNVCVGLFMVAVDQRVLLVALPTLTGTFGTDLTTVQWTLLIYDLTLIGLVITVGRVGDLFGRKRIYNNRLSSFHLRLSPMRSVSLPGAAHSV